MQRKYGRSHNLDALLLCCEGQDFDEFTHENCQRKQLLYELSQVKSKVDDSSSLAVRNFRKVSQGSQGQSLESRDFTPIE